MPNEPKPEDKKITAEIKENLNDGDPVTAAAVVIDNPAEAVIETVTPEPVEEVIEENTPPVDPFTAGIDKLTSLIDVRFNGLDERLKAIENKPIANTQAEKKEVHHAQESHEPKPKKRGLRFRSKPRS